MYEELFDKKKALIKNISYSDKLKLMLQRIQSEIGEANANTSRLKTVLKHFSWAKQRFDSTADPVAKVALMLVPIATLLAFVATDERHQSEDRNRATKLLKIMSKSEFCLTIGVFADWNIVLQAFLRLYDKSDHDIALSKDETDAMLEVIDAVFVDGGLWRSQEALAAPRSSAPALPPVVCKSLTKLDVEPRFITEHVFDQLKADTYTFRGRSCILPYWPRVSREKIKEIRLRLCGVAKVAKERIKSEITEARDLLHMFNLRVVRESFGSSNNEALRTDLLRRCRKFAQMIGLRDRSLTRVTIEYREAAGVMAVLTMEGREHASHDQREMWGNLLRDEFVYAQFPGRTAPFTALVECISIYIAIEDGECSNERDIGKLRAFVLQSKVAGITLADDLMNVGECAHEESMVVDSKTCLPRRPTLFALECAELWRQVYGARMGCYHKHPNLKNPSKGSFASLKRGVLAAAGAVCARDPVSGSVVPVDEDESFQGFIHEALLPLGDMQATAGTASGVYWSTRFSNFTKNTTAKMALRRRPNMQPRRNFQRKRASCLPQKLVGVSKVAFLCPATPLVRGVKREEVPVYMCRLADLVVVCEWSSLQVAETEISLLHLLYIFARGVPVVTRSAMVLADGDPQLVSPSNIIRFSALKEKNILFVYSEQFRATHRLLYDGLINCKEEMGPKN